VVQPHAASEADKALLAADYPKAATLYQADLARHPGDAALTAGLVHALLHQEKVREAADAVKASLAVAPNSAALMSLRGEVELRRGTPWAAARSALDAEKLDPCNAHNRLLVADIERINSLYASSRKELEIAHRLDPNDPDIRGEWIGTLPRKQRIAEIEAYLSAPTGKDEESLRHWKMYLENLKKTEAEPHKACRLVSTATATEIPFQFLMQDATHVRAFGLDVKLNGHTARLQIDTGAGGLLISRSVAQHAGLKEFSKTDVGGIGDEGDKAGYTAYVDSIHIGNLEFQDCEVEVLRSRNVLEDGDGLIGMDVLSDFLVTLDYPMRKLLLGPLPPRPGETVAAPGLKTDEAEDDDSDEAGEGAKGTAPVAAATSSASAVAKETAAKASGTHGPYDRYIAPEMKSYTPVYRVGHFLILPAALNSEKLNSDNLKLKLFIMDTGAWATTISPQAAREVTKVYSNEGADIEGISGKVAKVYIADQVNFAFAHVSQKVLGVASFDTSNISKDVEMEISGFLGATTLNLLTTHIDYRDGLVKFDYDPNRGYKF
jgi:hypothetical protein